MPRYRKKPVAIEASQWFKCGDHDSVSPYLDRVHHFKDLHSESARSCEKCERAMRYHGWVDTLEGGHVVCPGDWIITGVRGEHYPCKPDIFAETYELVDV